MLEHKEAIIAHQWDYLKHNQRIVFEQSLCFEMVTITDLSPSELHTLGLYLKHNQRKESLCFEIATAAILSYPQMPQDVLMNDYLWIASQPLAQFCFITF